MGIAKGNKASVLLRTCPKLLFHDKPLQELENSDDASIRQEFLRAMSIDLQEQPPLVIEDEEHNPEYNDRAGEQIYKGGMKELRAGRGVMVAKKGLSRLTAELEDVETYENRKEREEPELDIHLVAQSQKTVLCKDQEADIGEDQIHLMLQQVRQHVQLVTQAFLLSYNHPYYHHIAEASYDMLLNLQEEGKGRPVSILHACNLPLALELVNNWMELFKHQTEEIVDHRIEFVHKNSLDYKGILSALLLKTIANSPVFLYTELLPSVPYKSPSTLRTRTHSFTHAEKHLVAFFMEHNFPHFTPDMYMVSKSNKLEMRQIANTIRKSYMPNMNIDRIMRLISNNSFRPTEIGCPIKFFYENNHKAATLVHKFRHIDIHNLVTPAQVHADDLPPPWQAYIYPDYVPVAVPVQLNASNILPRDVMIISSPIVCNRQLTGHSKGLIEIRPNGPIPPQLSFPNILPNNKETVSLDTAAVTLSSAGQDDSDDISEFWRSNSTVKQTKKKLSGAKKNRAKVRSQCISNLAVTDTPDVDLQKEENFAESYFRQLQSALNPDDYLNIIRIMSGFKEKTDSSLALYTELESNLLPKYSEVAGEFLLFFTEIQAHNPALYSQTSEFYELIDLAKELFRSATKDVCETVILQESEDFYGGSSCICTCHDVNEVVFKNRIQHCKECGIKFTEGKVFIEMGKALRPAVVSSLTYTDNDHNQRLNVVHIQCGEGSPCKQTVSPTIKSPISYQDEKHTTIARQENRGASISDSEEDTWEWYEPTQEEMAQSETLAWTREEDKIILKSFQESSDYDETLKEIAQTLESRSESEIRIRFHKLLVLLEKWNE